MAQAEFDSTAMSGMPHSATATGLVDQVLPVEAMAAALVEYQMLIAMEIEDILRGLGCAVVGPVGRLEPAVQLARDAELDAAVLDVNLDREEVFPVAEELDARGIPFVLSTGYGEAILPEKWRGRPMLAKPFRREQLERLVRGIVRSSER